MDERLARLEAAAEGAGCALVCPHRSSEELHSALIGEYLRGHAQSLEQVADAKLVDDGSCGDGKIKRVPSEEDQAVCIDRKRLEASAAH